jgi:membrane-associated phospholipid phosphatase
LVTSSFPSGHTATDLAFSFGVAQEMPALLIPLTVITTAAHWSMVRSRGHYPSDVLVGGVVGAAVAFAVWRLWPPECDDEEGPSRRAGGAEDEEHRGRDERR